MYITNKTKKYPCSGYLPTADAVSFFGVEGVTLPLAGDIELVSDCDNLLLAVQNCGEYARQTFTDGVLLLTNEPETAPQPEPEPHPQPPNITEIAEAMIDYETRISLIEMGVK